jgi:hypothetical protein
MFLFRRCVLVLAVVMQGFLTVDAQSLQPGTSQLNFGVVYDNAPDSLPLVLTNTLNRDVTVTNVRFYSTYGVPAFSTAYSWFVVPAAGSATLWIRFAPRHNVFHNTEMVIENDGLRGVTRVDLIGQGRYANNYYGATENLSEEPLKTALHTLLGIGYDTLGYVVARDSMFMQIDNQARNGQGAVVNTIESCYTGALATGYIDRTSCQTTFSFNTEHTFPQSFFSSLEPMRSDLHHLYACDDLSNNTRGNNPFGVVTNATWSGGGSKSDGNYFEPRDAQKGKASRSLLYFVIRYQDYSNFVQPQETLLRVWHSNFLPDSLERRRNDDIFSDQHNRNPFVDYPLFIERIHRVCGTSVEPSQPALNFPEQTIVYGYVTTGASVNYEYVIVNNGNVPIDLTGFFLSVPAVFSFSSGGNDVTLQPGEALPLIITAQPSSSAPVFALLAFNTTLPGLPSVSVPIYLNDPVINSVAPPDLSSAEVYPNPMDGQLQVRLPESNSWSVTLTDATGRMVLEQPAVSGKAQFDVTTLPAGCYLFTACSNGVFHRKVVVKR